MNIDVNSKVTTASTVSSTASSKVQSDDSVKFSDELSNLSTKEAEDSKKSEEASKAKEDASKKDEEDSTNTDDMGNVIDGLEDVVQEMNEKLNQEDDENALEIKDSLIYADKNNKNEGNALINNDMNIQEQKDLAFQMNANMNFNSDGQPFANFMNNQNDQKLSSSAKDLAEESAVLSTMSENIAMANKNRVLNERDAQNQSKVKTVSNSEGVKKVDKKSNVTVETVVKYDNIVMNEGDVDFFAKLVENGQANMTEATVKSSKVSKTLADMLAKSMKDNQPVRIDFDNNISVIIKVGRDGKISADFLPSSQVAEAYLKENLPLLRQKFEDNNIEYDELNHREQRQDEKERQKKEQKDE